MHFPKLFFVLAFCIILCLSICAQTRDTLFSKQTDNVVKINLSALVVKNVSMQFEHKIARRISFAANVHYMPFGKLPFMTAVEKAIDNPDVAVKKLKLGRIGLTPEVRFYLGRRGALRGFYLAPFANYTKYKSDLPVNYSDGVNDKTGIFSGKIGTITGGLLLGAQWKLSRMFYFDWWIIGPNYGTAKGDLFLTSPLTSVEQHELSGKIEELIADAPFDQIVKSYSINENGAVINAKGPWAGIRGLGFNVGVRF